MNRGTGLVETVWGRGEEVFVCAHLEKQLWIDDLCTKGIEACGDQVGRRCHSLWLLCFECLDQCLKQRFWVLPNLNHEQTQVSDLVLRSGGNKQAERQRKTKTDRQIRHRHTQTQTETEAHDQGENEV